MKLSAVSFLRSMGKKLEKLTEILTPGANDVWVVKGKNGKDILIPYIDDVVKKVDVKEKVILIEPMEGLAFMMRIDVLTLFPEMFTGVFGQSILKKAAERNQLYYNVVNFRDYADNKHKTVDDYPYGGGAGMVLKPQPIFDAVAALKEAGRSQKAKNYSSLPSR